METQFFGSATEVTIVNTPPLVVVVVEVIGRVDITVDVVSTTCSGPLLAIVTSVVTTVVGGGSVLPLVVAGQ